MAYYVIAMTSLMDRLEGENIVQEWLGDDAASLGELLPVKKWRDQINYFGPKYGYVPKVFKC